MQLITTTTHFLLPFLSLILLISGLIHRRINYVLISLWVTLVVLLIQYYQAGGEILGNYFHYTQAAFYTVNLFMLVTALTFLCFHLPFRPSKLYRSGITLFLAGIVTSVFLMLVNVWINARFVADKMPGTAIIQVVTFTPPDFCEHRYVFYKINKQAQVSYLCPNHYGFIPSVGYLEVAPNFMINQLKPHHTH